MPSLRSNKNKWHIPPYPPPEGVRCINVAVPDDPQWIALFYGAIYRLSQQIWYDRDEAHTAALVAAVWQDIYLQTIKGENECSMHPDCCPLRRNPRTGLYEQSPDGGLTWFQVDDGPWVDSLVDGSVYWPEPKQRTGSDAVIRCDAAWAAANVLQSFYQQTVGALLTSAVGGVIGIARYLANLAEILSGIAIGAEMIDIAGELFEQSAFFVDGGFPDTDLPTLRDILYCNSTTADGKVSFDFAAVEAEIGAISGTPWDGLSLLLALYLNEDGLNAAGNIDFDAGDCSSAPCNEDGCDYTTASQQFYWNRGLGTVPPMTIVQGNLHATNVLACGSLRFDEWRGDATLQINFSQPTCVKRMRLGTFPATNLYALVGGVVYGPRSIASCNSSTWLTIEHPEPVTSLQFRTQATANGWGNSNSYILASVIEVEGGTIV